MKDDVKTLTNADKLIAAIRSMGVDNYLQPISIKTADLAKKAGVAVGTIQGSLVAAIRRGDVVCCKVTPANGHPYNEWRAGPGMPPPEFKPLNTKRAGIAHGAPTKPLPVTTPAPQVSTPRPDIMNIEPPSLGAPQRAGGPKPPAAGKPETPPVAPAVAAKATPAPTPGVALKKEPTTRPVPAGDVPPRPQRITGNDGIALRIDHDGTLLIATDEGVLEIDPKQSRRLGHFMADTHGVWNPF